MLIRGTVALVTGSASGLGRGFANALLKAGAKVCVADIDTNTGELTTAEFRERYGENNVIFCRCDITSQTEFDDTFRRTIATFGGLNLVINNAGIGGETDDKWEKIIDVNMKGTLRGTRLGMKYLSKDSGGRGGVIINVASMAGVNPNPFAPVYASSKAGIIHATRSYATSEEATRSGIRLNVLCPAFVDTPMLRRLTEEEARAAGVEDKMNAFIKHVGVQSVEEVADAVMQMIADDSKNGLILRCAKNTGNQYSTLVVQDIPGNGDAAP